MFFGYLFCGGITSLPCLRVSHSLYGRSVCRSITVLPTRPTPCPTFPLLLPPHALVKFSVNFCGSDVSERSGFGQIVVVLRRESRKMFLAIIKCIERVQTSNYTKWNFKSLDCSKVDNPQGVTEDLYARLPFNKKTQVRLTERQRILDTTMLVCQQIP